MAFPTAPNVNDAHVEAGTSYYYDGTTWVLGTPAPAVPQSGAPLIPMHDPLVSYTIGQTVRHGTDLVQANQNIAPEAYTAAHWDKVGGGAGGGAGVTMSETAPATPTNGQLWYMMSTSYLFIYRTDISSWVQLF